MPPDPPTNATLISLAGSKSRGYYAGGANECVRDTRRQANASHLSNPIASPISVAAVFAKSTFFPPSPPSSPPDTVTKPSPIDIASSKDVNPPLTPTSSSESLADTLLSPPSAISSIFPMSTSAAQPVESPVQGWQLATVDTSTGRTLYARATCVSAFKLVCATENVVALMDLAADDEAEGGLDCDALVLCLNKADPDLAQTLHALLYVGGAIVTQPPSPDLAHDQSKYVLVGLDL